MQVNIMEAEADFSELVRLLETKKEESIVVSRAGKPVVRITLYNDDATSKRIGVAKGKFAPPVEFDRDNEYIADLLTGETA